MVVTGTVTVSLEAGSGVEELSPLTSLSTEKRDMTTDNHLILRGNHDGEVKAALFSNLSQVFFHIFRAGKDPESMDVHGLAAHGCKSSQVTCAFCFGVLIWMEKTCNDCIYIL